MNALRSHSIALLLLPPLLQGAALSPDEERASFRLADPSLTVELVAAEPNVLSPVAIAWDAHGRMFVAEMIDYPLGPTTGQIRMLEDRNRDGRYEKAAVFADRLPFPNSVLPWNDGLLVTAAPDILFLKDTNGDGRADERRVLFTGFAEGNQQLRVNGLMWGLDGWVYGANGRSDGDIRPPGATNSISLRGHDFRFRPDTREFETVAGRSQFGLARDDWGNRFLSWNTIPIRHEAIASRYLASHPRMNPIAGIQNMLPPNDHGEVFPLTPAPQTFNKESTSHFNALAGLSVYRGDALPERYRGNAFVGETLLNLVHRRELVPYGASFVANRLEEKKEFLASTDPWFHPVNFATGPDGGLYIVDFYRQWVEHPGYVPEKMRREIAWRTGAEHGRIWRVRPRDAKLNFGGSNLNLSRASAKELAGFLAHPNGWWRDTAQRLLVERRDQKVSSDLKKIAFRSRLPQARVHALHTLQQFNALDERTLIAALKDSYPRVREVAVRLSEPRLKQSPQLLPRLIELGDDADASVRLQLALSIRQTDMALRVPILARLAARSDLDFNTIRAIRSTVAERPWLLLERMLEHRPIRIEFIELVRDLALDTGAQKNEVDCRSLVSLLSRNSTDSVSAIDFALFVGVASALDSAPQRIGNWGGNYPHIVNHLVPAARDLALHGAPGELYELSLAVLARAGTEDATSTLIALLLPPHPDINQAAAAAAITEVGDPLLFQKAFQVWGRCQISTRRKLLAGCTRSARNVAALVEALEQGTIGVAELDASVRQALLQIKSAALKLRIKQFFDVPADRLAMIEKFTPALQLSGNRQAGAELFAKLCVQCHPVQGSGQNVGPDLSGITSRSPEALLTDILDPNRQMSPDFVSYAITTTADETLTGLIVSETAAAVTLRRPALPDETIPRAQIKEIHASGRSLMPDGLEAGLTLAAFADLLEFLRQPDSTLLPPKLNPLPK